MGGRGCLLCLGEVMSVLGETGGGGVKEREGGDG